MTGHFGMRVRCRVSYSAPQIPKHPRSARAGHTLDICQTNSDLTDRQDNVAPWLCAQYHTQSFLLTVESGVKVTMGHTLASQ